MSKPPQKHDKDVFLMAVDTIDVIAKFRMGLSPAEIAKLQNVSEKTINKVIEEARNKGAVGSVRGGRGSGSAGGKGDQSDKQRLDRDARRKIRKEIADYIASGKSLGEAAEKYAVTENHVRNCCKEFGVSVPTKPGARGASENSKVSMFQVIAARLENQELSDNEIADMLERSRQYVSIVLRAANQAGLFLAIEKAKKAAGEDGSKELPKQLKRK